MAPLETESTTQLQQLAGAGWLQSNASLQVTSFPKEDSALPVEQLASTCVPVVALAESDLLVVASDSG